METHQEEFVAMTTKWVDEAIENIYNELYNENKF